MFIRHSTGLRYCMPESTVMDMELCVDFIVNRTGIDKEIVKQVLKTETDYWMELDPSY